MEMPSYIKSAGITGASIQYEWNSEVAMEFLEAERVRLYTALDKSNFKANMAIGVALTEWIVHRFEGQADLEDAHHRIEAARASAIDPAYVNDLDFELSSINHDKEIVQGPLELALYFLGEIDADYANGSIYLTGSVVRQALLARHIVPKKEVFEDWLSETLRRTAKIFPHVAEYDEDTETYDASHEKSVPREFFHPEFQYTDEAAEEALRKFLQTLDPKKNPYLRSPEEMKAKGFKGTPYTI